MYDVCLFHVLHEVAIVSQLCISFPYVLHGLCEDYLTCDIAFNAVMPLSRASTRGRYSRIEGVTHLFTELVHLYNLPLYWVCWGHKRLFVIWFQGCLRETIFILRLPRIDKPWVIPLREICYCPTELCAWRPNTSLREEGCVVDINAYRII